MTLYTGELAYDGPLYARLLSMTEEMHNYQVCVICMYMTDFAYDGPNFMVPLSLSYASSPVLIIMLYFNKKMHAYGFDLSILRSPLKNRMPKSFTTANLGHLVSKSGLGP